MKYHIFLAVLVLIAGFFLVTHALALTVSPVKIELSGDPGQMVPGELILLNEQNQLITFYASFENFESQGETGAPNFVPGQEGLASWIKAPASVTLGPQEKQTIPFSIEIPANAEPGGHFSAIFWSPVPPQSEGAGQVAVGAKIGTLVLLKVSGDIKEGGAIADFSTVNERTWFDALPITFSYRFQNSGDDRVKPLGTMTIKNMFGRTSAIINANASEGNVLPQSVRKFTVTWATEEGEDKNTGFLAMAKKEWAHFAFGWYTANLQVNYGGSNQADAAYTFYIIPWQLLSIVFVLLIIVLLMGFFAIKKYNRWIIFRATRK